MKNIKDNNDDKDIYDENNKNKNKLKIKTILYGNIVRNAISEIADILNKSNTQQIKGETKEPRVIQKI